uniref:Ankyrin repeat domain 13D n=1 Tax=Aquila chrysaetos chrysaetos TaxID=223781 RepID=A0A663FBR5_AQUCH
TLPLAVSLGHLESVRVLLRHNANVGRENANGWTVLQEAVSTGDPEMVQLVLQYRDYQRATRRLAGIPELLSKLRRGTASDFYVEMKWEFTSWVPLVSKVCPSDVYRVWKRGESLRVDTTLLGFEHMTWQRGRRSYIFKGEDEGAVVMEVDHDKQVVYTETLALALHEPDLLLAAMQPSEEHVAGRLTSPIVSTHLDTRNIAFERNKSGIWGWRSEKMEVVSGYEAKVYSASNVELVTKTRTEHLSDQDKSRSKGSKTPFHSFLGIAQQHGTHNGAPVLQAASPTNPTAITPEEYFDPHFDLETRNIGRPIEMSSKVQRFKATLWLCEQHPLSLAEQVTPIIDLMAPGPPPHAPAIPSARLSSRRGGGSRKPAHDGEMPSRRCHRTAPHTHPLARPRHVSPCPPPWAGGGGSPLPQTPPQLEMPHGDRHWVVTGETGSCPTAAPPRPVSPSRCSNNGVTSSLPDNGQQAADFPHTLPAPGGETEAGLGLSPRAPRRHRVSASEAERFWGGGCHCQGRSWGGGRQETSFKTAAPPSYRAPHSRVPPHPTPPAELSPPLR